MRLIGGPGSAYKSDRTSGGGLNPEDLKERFPPGASVPLKNHQQNLYGESKEQQHQLDYTWRSSFCLGNDLVII
jgi:hypothetical protein